MVGANDESDIKLEEPHDRLMVDTFFKDVFVGCKIIFGGALRGCQTGSAGSSEVTSGALVLRSRGGIAMVTSASPVLTTLAGRELMWEGPSSEQVVWV